MCSCDSASAFTSAVIMMDSNESYPPGHTVLCTFGAPYDPYIIVLLEDSWKQHDDWHDDHRYRWLSGHSYWQKGAPSDELKIHDWNVRKLPQVFTDDGLCVFCELAQCDNVRCEEIKQIHLSGDNQGEKRQRLLQLLEDKGGMACCVKPAKTQK